MTSTSKRICTPVRATVIAAVLAALTAVATVATGAIGAPAAAATATVGDEQYAPLDRVGPPLSVPATQLAAALRCEGQLRGSRLQPVLLSPGTTATPEDNFSWNYARAFAAQGRPFCYVAPPQRTMGDIQVAGEHLVYAIRTMHARAGRPVAVLGHSQGGMSMRWALRFWPDTRRMVDDVIGMAPPNQGTTAAAAACQPGVTRCVPALWQQDDGAAFIAALNSRAETFRGISYTNTFTRTDEEVQPSLDAETAASSLRTGDGAITNIAVQDLCPTDVYEHNLHGTVDPVTYALVLDALDHPGPAVPSRVPAAVCLQQYQPGVDPANAENYIAALRLAPGFTGLLPGVNVVGAPEVDREPSLRCYVFAVGCPQPATVVTNPEPAAPATGAPVSSPAAAARPVLPATGGGVPSLAVPAFLLLAAWWWRRSRDDAMRFEARRSTSVLANA